MPGSPPDDSLRVLVLSSLPGDLRQRLAAVARVTEAPADALSDAEVAARAGGYDALLTLLLHRVGEKTLALAEDRLRMVANCAVGVDNIDLAAATRRGVVVTNTPGVLTDATADLAWGLILAVARHLPAADRHVRAGRFHGWRPEVFLGRSLAGGTLGVIGAGRIGRAVLARAAGFGMRRIYFSRTALPEAVESELGCERRGFSALLGEADVVSLHVPLTADTRHLIGRDELMAMRSGSILINTARGPVVDEAALAEALAAGQLGGAGLDVFEEEPKVHPGLLTCDNVVLAPHIGSATHETRHRMAELCVEDLVTYLSGGGRPRRSLTPGAVA